MLKPSEEVKTWTPADWVNQPWCEAFVMPLHQGGSSPERNVTVFYDEAVFPNGTTCSALFDDKYNDRLKDRITRLGQPHMRRKMYVFRYTAGQGFRQTIRWE